MPKTDADLKQLNADPEQATGDTNPGRQTDRQGHKHPPMNTQEVTDSHTLKVTQTDTQKYYIQGAEGETAILRYPQAGRQM